MTKNEVFQKETIDDHSEKIKRMLDHKARRIAKSWTEEQEFTVDINSLIDDEPIIFGGDYLPD